MPFSVQNDSFQVQSPDGTLLGMHIAGFSGFCQTCELYYPFTEVGKLIGK